MGVKMGVKKRVSYRWWERRCTEEVEVREAESTVLSHFTAHNDGNCSQSNCIS